MVSTLTVHDHPYNHLPVFNVLWFFFSREVLDSPLILNVPNKVNWKNCVLPKEQETEMTVKFRDNFQPFDFTLEDD